MKNLCETTASERRRDGSITFKPMRDNRHVGTCEKCIVLGKNSGLM
jgi:hypothetical protein